MTPQVEPPEEVTPSTYEVTRWGRPQGVVILFGFTDKERERMAILLEPNVSTYADGAKRLGITEGAMKQTMSRIKARYTSAKSFCNTVEIWRRKRREHRRRTGR